MNRAVSTVVDVAVFLLFVTGAVAVLYAATPPADSGHRPPEETATVLGESTTAVRYESAAGQSLVRRGTLAELLAAAAVANATIDGDRRVGNGEFVERTVDTVAKELGSGRVARSGGQASRTQVRAIWTPHDTADIEGEVVIGNTPAADADVHVATLIVPVGRPRDRPANESESGDQSPRTPATLANATHDLWFPRAARSPIRANRTAASTVARYQRVQELLVDPARRVNPAENQSAASHRIREALADRYRRTEREDSASNRGKTAERSVEVVEIVVRTWDP